MLLVTAVLPAQGPTVATLDVAIAPAAASNAVPAVAWLRTRWLPQQAQWPRGLDPEGALRLRLDADGLAITACATPLPAGAVACGSLAHGGAEVLFECRADGVEDWFVPVQFALPESWRHTLAELDALAFDHARTLGVAVLVGHVAGGLDHDDPVRDLLQAGASHCGDLTFTAWRTESHLRVRGRSDGGLTLPAALLWLAHTRGTTTHGRSLRAFAARDADATEAARQLLRSPAGVAQPTLRALLHADDPTRLAAIDALVRQGATEQLPAIVTAAAPDTPWATLAATDAVRELWPGASPQQRQRTREALARSQVVTLRGLDPDRALPASPTSRDESSTTQVRAMVWLGLFAVGLFWLLRRERLRLDGREH